MKIPDSFKLGRYMWQVVHAYMPSTIYGRIYPGYKVVQINTHERKPKQQAETFWHEITHAILYDMGDPRWSDEKFVTAFSKRLNQVIQTARFKDGTA